MKKLKSPIISKNFLYLKSEYNASGRHCTRIIEPKKEILVEKEPKEVIDDTLKYFCYDLKGALKGAKSIIGNKKFCPVNLYPAHNIIIFPYKAMDSDDNIWFNSNLIDSAQPSGIKATQVLFDGGQKLLVNSSYRCFNIKLLIADQLWKVNNKRSF